MSKMGVKSSLKAIGLMSGGLDSSLAVKIIKDLKVDVYGIHFVLPWHPKPNPVVFSMAEHLAVPLEIFYFGDEFIDLLKKPKYGYGKAINPCVDCHAYQLKKAKEYMVKLGADFVFTGEVLGQRPMSQLTHSLKKVEEESGLEGLLLRPLSAKRLPPTLIEQQGKIDRNALFDFFGRGRSDLIKLGQKLGIADYIPTGGGCLLADKNFATRLRDAFEHGTAQINDIALLSAGRHFRLSPTHKVIVGRDDQENAKILEYADEDDLVFQFKDEPGPVVLLRGKNPTPNALAMAAAIVKRYSKFREQSIPVWYSPKGHPDAICQINPVCLNDQELQAKKI